MEAGNGQANLLVDLEATRGREHENLRRLEGVLGGKLQEGEWSVERKDKVGEERVGEKLREEETHDHLPMVDSTCQHESSGRARRSADAQRELREGVAV